MEVASQPTPTIPSGRRDKLSMDRRRESPLSRYKRSKTELGNSEQRNLASIEEALTDRSQISRERSTTCGRIFRQSWWNPRFYSIPLEKQLQKKAIDFLRNRFRITAICLSVFSLLWIVVFSINIPLSEQEKLKHYSPDYSLEMIIGGAVFFVVSTILLIVSVSKLYHRAPVILSFALCFLLIVSSWLLVPSIRIFDSEFVPYSSISLINQFALTTVVVLVIYTLLHKPIGYCVVFGVVYGVVLEVLVVLFGYGILQDEADKKEGVNVFSTSLIARLTLSRVLLHICLNIVGFSTAYWFQVRLHDTFWKVVQCLILQKALGLDRQLQEKTLSSLMPEELATELMDDEFTRKCMMFAIQKNQPEYDPMNLPRPFPIHYQDNVTILFADIVGFTTLSANMSAETLVKILNDIFSSFDDLAVKHECEKVCTLGDCYFCVSGCPKPCDSHASNVVDMGLAIIDALQSYSDAHNLHINMRVGIHTGSVYFGVMGCRRFKFDVWSEDVNLANQIESLGIPGKVIVSETTKRQLSGAYLLKEIPPEQVDPSLRKMDYFIVSAKRQTHLCNPAKWRKKIRAIDVQAVSDTTTNEPAIKCPSDSEVSIRRCLTMCCPSTEARERHGTESSSQNSSTNPIIDIISKQGQLERYVSLTQVDNPFSEHQSAVIAQIMELLQEKDINFDTFFSTSLHPLFLQFDDEELEKSYRSGGLHLEDYVTGKSPEDEFGFVVAKRSYFVDVLLSLVVLLLVSVSSIVVTADIDNVSEWVFWALFLVVGLCIEVPIVVCVASALWPRRFPQCFSHISKFVLNWRVKTLIGLLLIYYPMVLVCINLFICSTNSPGSLEGVAHTEMSFFIALTVLVASILFVDISYLVKIIGAFLLVILVVILSVTVHSPQCYSTTPPSPGNTSNATTIKKIVETPTLPIEDNSNDFKVYFHTFVIPLTAIFFVMLTILLGTVNRKSEVSVRMSFKGRMEAVFQQAESKISRNQIDSLIRHIIPKHVASELRLRGKYSRNHECVGVIFATIVNFNEFCQAEQDRAIDCIRILNEIVSEFDELLDRPEFIGVEKIKTIGSTYMAASGLNEENPASAHLINLICFALEMQNVIQRFNHISNFNFHLRIGFNYGQVTSGVVGKGRLLFDIWGDTVNIASRMDTTGRIDRIHMPFYCVPVLENYFTFEKGVDTFVKGRGMMVTVLVRCRKRHILRFVQPDDINDEEINITEA